MKRKREFRGRRIDNGEQVRGYLAADDQIIVWDTEKETGRMFCVDTATIEETEKCTWRKNAQGDKWFHPDCTTFNVCNWDPEEWGFKFCPFCGRPVETEVKK